jgi:hypothetical protein
MAAPEVRVLAPEMASKALLLTLDKEREPEFTGRYRPEYPKFRRFQLR